MSKANRLTHKQYLTELALREWKARCLHCKVRLTPSSAPWIPYCSFECKSSADEVQQMKQERTT